MRFDKSTQIQNVVSGSTNWKDVSYFIMLLVSSLDLEVQKGRADCLQLTKTVIHCFQIQLARVQSKHLQEFSAEPCML